MNKYVLDKQAEFNSAIDFFKKDIASLRTGRANPAILEGIMAEAYGAKTPLSGLASINVSDAKSLVISPWDKNIIKDIEKAVVAANLGVGVVNEGDKIRITVPSMTEENRRELVKKLNEKMEKARITIRQARDEAKEAITRGEEEKEIGEDEKFRFIKELDEEVGKKNEELKNIRDKKEEEILTI
ncbi:MAG: ribosome recycling factor [Patescibacteria group bacterium]|nr:ribosome recycling factor [Patescibacteria group bacterium]